MATKKKKKKPAPKKRPAKKVTKKRAIKRKPVKKPAKKTKPAGKVKKEVVIGKVTHYFPKVNAAVIKLKTPLAVGGQIKVKGHTTDFQQAVTSMQIDRVPINAAKKGDEIGLQVISRVRRNDTVYKA